MTSVLFTLGRFPRVYFEFASDELTAEGKQRVRRVARLLARHPKLRVRIHGYAQPNAPGPIGECLAQVSAVLAPSPCTHPPSCPPSCPPTHRPPWQARATAVRAHCVRLLQDPGNAATHAPSYAAEDPASGEPAPCSQPVHPAPCTPPRAARLWSQALELARGASLCSQPASPLSARLCAC